MICQQANEDKELTIAHEDLVIRLYCAMQRIRLVEEEIARIYPSDKIKSPVHLSIGQEAVSVGVCEALCLEDIVFGTYRGHALYLAKGGDLKQMIAELYGKVTGCAKGKGGSMHLVDTANGIMGTSAVVGTTIPNAVGYAYAVRYLRKDVLVASFFGDGAVEEGVFWESLNFAVLKSLPVIFVCENNQYAIHSKLSVRQGTSSIVEKVQAYGLPIEKIEGNDVLAIYNHVNGIASQMRKGQTGPFFIECMTYRWREHVGPNEDYEMGYREQSEVDYWMQHDQIKKLGALIPLQKRRTIDDEILAEIQDAIDFAETSPFPNASDLAVDLFKEP
jgi:TPP-dependent pyruvate/acetoin dehydrogenase alpha subunit